MEENAKAWSASNLRLIPYTRDSLARQNSRCKSAEARREEHGFRKERVTNLPECECVSISPEPLPGQILYTPLEDLGQFDLEKTFCVIAKRSSSYYLYRYSAESSLFLFSPWSSIRKCAISLSCHRYFELFVMTTILLNCVFLALSQPIEETEYVFLGIYTVEMMIKIIAKGFILNKYAYLRNPWNWLDFIVVLSGYVTISLQAIGVAIGNLSGLRTFRVLRALKTVSITPGLKTIVNAMIHSLGMLAEVMMLTVFCLMVFALLALQLYVGVLRHKCVLNGANITHWDNHVNNRSMWLLDEEGQPTVCGNKTGCRHCPQNYTCLPGIGTNPNFGYTNFDTYGWALLNTFQLITLDYWEDVYDKINATTGPTSVLFFTMVVFFGSFYLINLTLAVVAIAYEEEAATTLRERDRIKKFTAGFPNRLYTTFFALKAKTKMFRPFSRKEPLQQQRWCSPRRGTSIVTPTRVLHTPRPHVSPTRSAGRTTIPGETNYEEDEEEPERHRHASLGQTSRPMCMGDAPDILIGTGATILNRAKGTARVSEESHRRSRRTCEFCRRFCRVAQVFVRYVLGLRKDLENIVTDPLFDFVITICILLNTAFLSFEHHGMTAKTEKILKLGNLIFTVIFSLEAAVKLIALGKRYFRSKWNIFDLVVVILSLTDLSFETAGGLSVLRTFRLLRVVKLAQAWTTMRLLLTIIASTLGAVGNMTLVLAVIVYIFAIVGVQLFGDIYTEENFAPDPVPRWNFRDFWHALLMVFRILCGEWVQPLWDCMRVSGEKHQVCIALFLAALTVGNFLVLNLFLAMLLNSFNTRELNEMKQNRNSDSKLLKGFRRIKGVIRRKDPVSLPTTSTEQSTPLFHKRRWSEPAIVLHSASRRHSDSSVDTCERLRCSREFSNNVGSTDPLKRLVSCNKHKGNAVAPQVIQEEPEDDSRVTSPSKEDDPELGEPRQVPDCCPACLFGTVKTEGCPIFQHWTRYRMCVLRVVDHRAFEWIVLILIFCSSIILCFEDDYLPERPHLMKILRYLNIFFTACFVIEVLLKWMAYGFVVYFKSLWNTLDFIIACVSVASVVAESSGSGLNALRAIRTLRALRPLRAISRWEGMKIVVNALMSAIPSIFNVLLVCLVFWLIFGIMGVQFFGGRFYRCVDERGQTLPVNVTPDVDQCLLLNYSWVNRDVNFDNVGNAYLALFQVATFEGWTEVMEYATDATEVGRQPYTEANFPAYIYFVTFIICGSFFTLNLFIGVIIDNFNMLKKKYEGGIVEMFLTDSQKAYYTAMLKLGRRKPQRIVTRPRNLYLNICYDIAMSRKFEMVVFLLIILNMVAMTVEHYQQPEEITLVLETLNIVFTTLFGIEALIKILGLRQYYFTFPWNIFDLTVIVLSFIGIVFEEALQKLVISPTLLRVVRLIRLGRILRLIRAAKGIRKLLFALVISLPALFNVGALLLLVTFVYAIVGMALFGHTSSDFRAFGGSMLLLFRLCTSAGWNDVLVDLGGGASAAAYLVSYVVVSYMVVINMYIAVILENLGREEGISEEDVEAFYSLWSSYDPHATQFVPLSRLSELVGGLEPPLGVEQPNEPALAAMELPIAEGDRVHCLDVLHGLVRLQLGHIDDGGEAFRLACKQVDRRFRKSFPTRNLVRIVSTTLERKKQQNAARTIQRAYRRHVQKNSS